jgi:hypothetical protein
MKYHASDQIRKIQQLQNDRNTYEDKIKEIIIEINQLGEELKDTYGYQFVCDNIPYKLDYKSASIIIHGNCYWLSHNSNVKVI